uniref:Uncharacterized protein n=1 Tax=Oryza rufipogon TaxID=4529 RepID=A0A0E0NZ98_ORYRU
METTDGTNGKLASEPSVEMDDYGKLPWLEAERRCNIYSMLRVDETRLSIQAGMADGYRRRALMAASTLVPATCGSAGGMPCVPAARGGG